MNWFNDLYGKLNKEEDPEYLAALSPGSLNVPTQNPMPTRMPAADTQTPPVMNPQVKEYLTGKYGLGERQKIVDQNAKDAGSLDFKSALAALGAGFQGQNSMAAGSSMKKQQQDERAQKLLDFDKGREQSIANDKLMMDQERLARESDPSSMESQQARALAIKMGVSPEMAKNMTASQFKGFSDVTSKLYDIDQRALDRKEARDERRFLANQSLQDKRDARDATRNEKLDAANEKKASAMKELEDRRVNIEDNVTLLENMIKDKGTYEAFGSHNADMNRLTDQIATDMAKLMDPQSVARPQEVEMFKKSLVNPNVTETSNDTALNILKNFRSEVNKRAGNAYRIRGLENPGSAQEQADASVDARRRRIAELKAKRDKALKTAGSR